MIGLVIVMHKGLAQAFHEALEHILGPQEQIGYLSVAPNDDAALRAPDIARAIAEVDSGDGVVLVTDVVGGTPCNIATAALDSDRVHVVAGVNLPMLIKLARVRRWSTLENVVAEARAAGQIHYYCDTSGAADSMETGIWVGNTETLSRDVEIVNVKGLHARASMKFVKCAEQFDADIEVSRGNETVGGTSIMGLLMLAATKGSHITITARGPEARAALEALTDLVARGFDEQNQQDETDNGEASVNQDAARANDHTNDSEADTIDDDARIT